MLFQVLTFSRFFWASLQPNLLFTTAFIYTPNNTEKHKLRTLFLTKTWTKVSPNRLNTFINRHIRYSQTSLNSLLTLSSNNASHQSYKTSVSTLNYRELNHAPQHKSPCLIGSSVINLNSFLSTVPFFFPFAPFGKGGKEIATGWERNRR